MKKSILAFIVISVMLTSFGCEKESEPCKTNNTCTVKFTNKNSTNPYNIYINGTYKFQINGNGGTNTSTVTPGSLSLKAEQASGYVLTPTIKTSNLSVVQCGNGNWEF